MKIQLEELTHQRKALDAILAAMPPLLVPTLQDNFGNPLFVGAGYERKFIDIKMETGTGKTYVYTRTMYELHQELGLYKFIIIVPSIAIKEGTKNFIDSDYARQHFSRFFPNKRIELHTINAGDFASKKGKRKNFPSGLKQFCEATRNEKNTIQCLLLSDKGFLDRRDSALFKEDYDQTFFGGTNCPATALCNTRPVVIIDEPHRIKLDGKTYENIIEKIKPQLVMRFGATFAEVKGDKRRGMVYFRGNPQYDLGAVEAFNQDLVKGVSVQYPNLPESLATKYKVKTVNTKQLVLTSGAKEWTIKVGELLPFEGNVTFEGSKTLSNDLELEVGMELVSGVFSNSYQELLLSQAIDAHFEKEYENFHRNGLRVKTNALFFIDSISSYRDQNGWLKTTFETLLKRKVDRLLKKYTEGEYHEYLLATKKDLSLSHGGYFAKDWGEPDDSSVAEERDDILHKERTLPFKKENGAWNIRRFFFSKWTLREGWDNPNVFTICKLRTSGSEMSKIQEVGRGLRLPVDEQGNRLSGEEWFLNFIIGWDEKDFAEKLIGEINSDAKIKLDTQKLTDEMIKIICQCKGITENELLERLDELNIIKRDNTYKAGGFEKLLEFYPELAQLRIKSGKVTIPGEKRKTVKLRIHNWKLIEEKWNEISKRYMLAFDRIERAEIENLFDNVLKQEGVFDDNRQITITSKATQKSSAGTLALTESHTSQANIHSLGKLPYAVFVKKLADKTAIPISIIQSKLWAVLQTFAKRGESKSDINEKLNEHSLNRIVERWKNKFAETFAAKYGYNSLDFMASTTIYKDGNFAKEIDAGNLGIFAADCVLDDPRNLYEPPPRYDSEIELEVEKIKPHEVITVFGKIPRRAIKVPTYTGGSTTPDFIFAKNKDNKTELVLLVETKSGDLRTSEEQAVGAQEKFFKNIDGVEWRLIKNASDVQSELEKMIPK